ETDQIAQPYNGVKFAHLAVHSRHLRIITAAYPIVAHRSDSLNDVGATRCDQAPFHSHQNLSDGEGKDFCIAEASHPHGSVGRAEGVRGVIKDGDLAAPSLRSGRYDFFKGSRPRGQA